MIESRTHKFVNLVERILCSGRGSGDLSKNDVVTVVKGMEIEIEITRA